MRDDRVYEHPSFGIISISRIGCTKNSNCFMAEELDLGGHIQIEVKTARLYRRLSKHYVHPDKGVLSLRLSYHQFAELITSLNLGGTPCTLEWITPAGAGEVETYCPPPPPKTEFESELRETLAEGLEALKELKIAIEALSAKGKAGKGELTELRKKAEAVSRHLVDNVPFVEESFQEAMAATVSRSKIEASAWMDDQVRALGLRAIAQSNQTLELEESDGTDKPAGELEE